MILCGLVQAASADSLFDNMTAIKQFAAEAKEKNCRILCFPEAYLTGYSSVKASELAIEKTDPIFDQIGALAREYGFDIMIGYLEREINISNPDGKSELLYIAHDIFTADGNRYSYRKTHLGDREAKVFTAGRELPVFPLSCGVTAAIQLCVENHYPDITRTYSLKGAEIVFAPHAVPRRAGDRQKIWSKFIPARSYDNRVYMACCNQWGGVYVTDPAGDVSLSYFGEEDKLLCFTYQEEEVHKYHCGSEKMAARYYPSKRKTQLYL